jgi:uncharacterized protein (TIGR02300 family)
VAKADLGTKRICPTTGRKFYDLNKTPVISPYSGEVVPIAVAPVRSRPEPAPAPVPRPVPVVEKAAPETEDAEFVSLEDAEAEQQGKKKAPATPAAEGEEEEIAGGQQMDETFIEEQEEGDPDVTDIIGDTIEKEEET